jgi:uncharacterized membrane protein
MAATTTEDGGLGDVPRQSAPRWTGGVVLPSQDDPLLRAASEGVGGPAGRRVRPGTGWWTPLRVVLALATVVFALGVIERGYCRDIAWPRDNGQQYAHACYSDIPHLYRERGLAEGHVPYFDGGGHPPLEYPVLTGLVVGVTGAIARTADGLDAGAVRFYDVNALLLGMFALVLVVAVFRLAGRRPWDAALVAAAPVLALTGTINWDLVAVALSTLALLAWARARPVLAGVMLGLAVCAKFYPLLLLGPLFLLCLRAHRLRHFGTTALSAVLTWLVVNAPVVIGAPDGWKAFYAFNQRRGADFGSVWFVLERRGVDLPPLNALAVVTFLVLGGAIAWLTLRAPRRPRLPQVAFLVLVAFVVTNKVWSPQYALWLLPLAALARPRWRDLLIWQAGEVLYFFAVWYYLLGAQDADRALPPEFYYRVVWLRLALTLWFAGLVVRDILKPEHDPVRADGSDDPAGGVLDAAEDVVSFVRRRSAAPALGELSVVRNSAGAYLRTRLFGYGRRTTRCGEVTG